MQFVINLENSLGIYLLIYPSKIYLNYLCRNRPSIAKESDVILNLFVDKHDMATLSLDTSKVFQI